MNEQIRVNNSSLPWIEGELRLAGVLDNRMIALLQAIEQSGSINQAAKEVGLSYKGAWQIIERANNGAPQALVTTATGGSKGGGTCLTAAGRSMLALFARLEQQHQRFIEQLNRELTEDADILLLLQRLEVKTSAQNQLFGTIGAIRSGAVHAEISIILKSGAEIIASVGEASLSDIGLSIGTDAVLLLNSVDITLAVAAECDRFSARNCLPGKVVRVQQDEVNAEVIVLLPGGETLAAMLTRQSAQKLALVPDSPVYAVFKSNAPILGVKL